MKKSEKTAMILMVMTAAAVACGYNLNRNVNIRFGLPGKKGTIMTKPGYVVMYSNKRKTPVWVSYHLSADYFTNTITMKRDYMHDVKLKKGRRAEVSDYKKRGRYDRARMVPIKDMLRDEKKMKATWLLTNICPMHHDLNRGKWRELEDLTRVFVLEKRDVWIMAGPVFEKRGRTETDNLGTLGKNKVNIPTHFYKIVVYQGKDFGFNAVTFLFENKKQQPGRLLVDHVVSVDRVEELTGLDFLHILPDQVEDILEKEPAGEKTLKYFGIL